MCLQSAWGDWSWGGYHGGGANEAGQVVVSLRGGTLIYLCVVCDEGTGGLSIVQNGRTELDREISCLDLNPFRSSGEEDGGVTAMEVDGSGGGEVTKSRALAVGLWDDFSVRLLSLDATVDTLKELLRINLGPEDTAKRPTTATAANTAKRPI